MKNICADSCMGYSLKNMYMDYGSTIYVVGDSNSGCTYRLLSEMTSSKGRSDSTLIVYWMTGGKQQKREVSMYNLWVNYWWTR